jgi:hypothetical protein
MIAQEERCGENQYQPKETVIEHQVLDPPLDHLFQVGVLAGRTLFKFGRHYCPPPR